jgi:hypothetical protein
MPGEELVGYYLGKTKRNGAYGEYTVVLLGVLDEAGAVGTPRFVNGAALLNAVDGANVQIGALLRIVFGGLVEISGDRKMKAFEVFLGEGTLSVDDIAQLTVQ